jgi:hypothetical protein
LCPEIRDQERRGELPISLTPLAALMLAINSALWGLRSGWYRFARAKIAGAEVTLIHGLDINA